MGAPSRPQRDMQEVFRDTSSQKMQKHLDFVQSLLERGYEIESQEEIDDKGSDNEMISYRVISILKPIKDFSLPMLKFDASEKYGDYFDDREEFFSYDEPRFELKAYQKGSDLKSFRDPWKPLDADLIS